MARSIKRQGLKRKANSVPLAGLNNIHLQVGSYCDSEDRIRAVEVAGNHFSPCLPSLVQHWWMSLKVIELKEAGRAP